MRVLLAATLCCCLVWGSAAEGGTGVCCVPPSALLSRRKLKRIPCPLDPFHLWAYTGANEDFGELDALVSTSLGESQQGGGSGGTAALESFAAAVTTLSKTQGGEVGLETLFQNLVKAVRKHDGQVKTAKSSRSAGNAISELNACKIALRKRDTAKLYPIVKAAQPKQATAATKKKKEKKKWVHNPAMWSHSDRGCGLSNKRREILETTMGCSPLNPITVIGGSYSARYNLAQAMTHIFAAGRMTFMVLGITEETLPSKSCCDVYSRDRCANTMSCGAKGSQGGSSPPWRKKVTEACCGKTAQSRCDLSNRKKTCMPLSKTMPFETPRDLSWHLKCHMRVPTKLPKVESLQGALGDAAELELQNEDSLEAHWGRRRRRRRRRFRLRKFIKAARKSFKKVSSPIRQVAKRAAKFIIKAVPLNIRRKVSRAVKRATKKISKAVKSGIRKMGTALAKKMIPAVLKLITKLSPNKYKPLFKSISPYLAAFNWKGAFTTMIMQMRPLLVGQMMTAMSMNHLFVDCGIRDNLLPALNPKYRIRFTRSPLDTKSPGCKGNGASSAKGPVSMIVHRTYKGRNVCTFTYGMQAYRCANDKWNCCEKWSWSFPRISFSDYNPLIQDPNHDCKKWYLSTMTWASSFTTIAVTMSWLKGRQRCLKSSTCDNTDYCSAKKCDKAKPGCKWDPNKKVHPLHQEKPGMCVPKRV